MEADQVLRRNHDMDRERLSELTGLDETTVSYRLRKMGLDSGGAGRPRLRDEKWPLMRRVQ